MSQSHFQSESSHNHPIQTNLSVPSAHSLTGAGGVVNMLSSQNDDEEDNDICPVCDGVCTCDNRSRPTLALQATEKLAQDSSQPMASTSNLVPSFQSLKIKLLVPQGMLTKPRKVPKPSTYVVKNSEFEQVYSSTSSIKVSPNHRSGIDASSSRRKPARLVKQVVSSAGEDQSEDTAIRKLPSMLSLHKRKAAASKATKYQRSGVSKLAAARKGKATMINKGYVMKKRKSAAIAAAAALRNCSDSDLTDLEDLDDDGRSVHFPTFVSASAMSSTTRSDGSDSDSDSGFDSDSSMEAEEENYILAEERRREKARVRKLGESSRLKAPQNDWVIHSRAQSVGLDEVDIDEVSNQSESDRDDNDNESGNEEDDEMDESAQSTYHGLVTGWSEDEEDEESGLDAELFFANLGDTSSSSSENGDQSELDMHMSTREGLEPLGTVSNLNLDADGNWDPALNFLHISRGTADLLGTNFAVANAHVSLEELHSSGYDRDVEMETNCEESDYEDVEDFGLEESDGATTQEELVDEQGLPTPRAMKLFKWPVAISSINPLSTVSPSTSPSRGRQRNVSNSRRSVQSPRPADILAGNIYAGGDSDEYDFDDSPVAGLIMSQGGQPRMGTFAAAGRDSKRIAVLDGTNKQIPSPFPPSRHRRMSSAAGVNYSGNERGRSSHRHSSVSEAIISLQPHVDLASSEHTAANALAVPVELHDVLDASFLGPEQEPTSESDVPQAGHFLHLTRWAHIPMATFRDSRETGLVADGTLSDWQAETPRAGPSRPFGMKSSPFSGTLWQHKTASVIPKGTRRPSRFKPPTGMSPVIFPVLDGDNPVPPFHAPQNNFGHQQQRKSRKELRKELKIIRKSSQRPKSRPHPHNHTPNSKNRSSNSMQRSNFFASSPVPPLNI